MPVRGFGAVAFAAALFSGCVFSAGSNGTLLPQARLGVAQAAEQLPAKSPAGLGNSGAGLGSAPKAAPSTVTPKDASNPSTTSDPAATPPVDKTLDRTTLGKPAKDAIANKAKTESATDEKADSAGNSTSEMEVAAEPAIPTDDLKGELGKVPLPGNSGNTGNLTYSVNIDVPAYRGLEPKIALNYNSARKTKIGGTYQGWLGFGWGLDGFDVIERAGASYGIPGFDNNDIFLLNGEQLVSCEGTSSPSCLGANSTGEARFATENESYRRIRFNSTTREWKITDRAGTVSTFRSVAAAAGTNPAGGTVDYNLQANFRWLLSSVTDTKGNSVRYEYTCPDLPVCYPAWVGYNSTLIRFSYDQRPDFLLMANGFTISYTKYRLKTINTTVSGQQRGAYSLSYDQAPFSNASRLTNVYRYGKDVAINTNTGVISSGTSKLIAQLAYQDTNASYSPVSFSKPVGLIPDMDLDGKDEVYGVSGAKILSHYSLDSLGAFSEQSVSWPNTDQYYERKYYLGRFDPSRQFRDQVGMRGRILALDLNKYRYSVERQFSQTTSDLGAGPETSCNSANGTLASYAAACSQMAAEKLYDNKLPEEYSRQFIVLDEDGHGVDKLLPVKNSSGQPYRPNAMLIGIGDFSGSGRQQPVFTGDGAVTIAVVSGNSLADGKLLPDIGCPWSRFSGLESNCQLADMNGDGLTDIIRFERNSDTTYRLYTYLFTGREFKLVQGVSTPYSKPGKSNWLRSKHYS